METIDRYVLEERLGAGGMGTVYRAYDPKLARRVALKLVRVADAATTGGGATARMLREARAAAALDHPNTVAIFDVGAIEGALYLAMELVPGRTLRELLASPPSIAERLRWITDVARALAAAHAVGIVHRDVKPENVMVRRDGVVKVLDFGLARSLAAGDPSAPSDWSRLGVHLDNLTQHGVVVGTPLYMAPEQVRGDAIDARADQFAWAVLAHEVLSLRRPWERHELVPDVLRAILDETPPPLRDLAPDVPIVVERVVERALAKSPVDRFPTMNEIVALLEPVVAASSAPGGTSTRAALASLPPRRLRLSARAAQATGFLLALALALIALLIGRRVRRDATSAPASSPAPAASPPSTPAPFPQRDASTSSSPEALAELRLALEGWRGGSRIFSGHMRRALAIDPELAEAHLFVGMALFFYEPSEGRRHLAEASRLRTRLDARGQFLLEAAQALSQGDAKAGFGARSEEAARRFPDDPLAQFVLASMQCESVPPDLPGAVATLERALAMDPGFAGAWRLKSELEAYLGRDEAALASVDRCLAVATSQDGCLTVRMLLRERDGRCELLEADARRAQALDPSNPEPYRALAGALAAQGRSLEAVRSALGQRWQHVRVDQVEARKAMDGADLAILEGDFAAARASAERLDALVASEPDLEAHAEPTRALLEIAIETGDDARAKAIAERFDARKDAWVRPPRAEDYAIFNDVTPLVWRVRAAADPRLELAPLRAAWLADWEARGGAWVAGYAVMRAALSVDTKERASSLLADAARYEPLPTFAPFMIQDGAFGRAELLAGDLERALGRLARASQDCRVLSEPIEQTWSVLAYADALAAKGDRDAACAAYTRVLERWGRAKRSISAARAKKQRGLLACK